MSTIYSVKNTKTVAANTTYSGYFGRVLLFIMCVVAIFVIIRTALKDYYYNETEDKT